MASPADIAAVTELLGRAPQGDFDVVVRDSAGSPVVIRNAPLLADGTPMPTRHWLVGAVEQAAVGRLEATGAVDQVEAELGLDVLERLHQRAAAAREASLPPDWKGPRASGGVAGTRRGVKCLHAHLAEWLAGEDDPVGAWTAARLLSQGVSVAERTTAASCDPLPAGAVAAIDCGTNSTRLLVVGADGTTLHRQTEITRLGEGVHANRRLLPAAIERTVAVLAEYSNSLKRFGVRNEAAMAVATSACRDAHNRNEFLDAAHAVLGFRPELLSGPEEARLSFHGATAQLPSDLGPVLVADIGGGSTELIVGIPGQPPTDAVSLDIGCVRQTEQFFASDPPGPVGLANAVGRVCDELDDVDRHHSAFAEARLFVGLAGTVTCLAAVDQGLETYERELIHHYVLEREEVEDWFRRLAMGTREDRLANPGMVEGRVDVIVGGLTVLVTLLRHYQLDHCLVSETDILHGLVAEHLAAFG